MKASRFRTGSSRSRRTDAAQRTQVLAAFDRSGLSAAVFARQQRLNYTTFCGWRQRRAKDNPSPAFVQVEVIPAPGPADLSAEASAKAELVIELGQARMRLGCAAQIALAAELFQFRAESLLVRASDFKRARRPATPQQPPTKKELNDPTDTQGVPMRIKW